MIKTNIRAGALPYTILVMLVICIICSMIVSVQFKYYQYYKKNETNTKLNDNLYSALNLVLSNSVDFNSHDNIELTLFDDISNVVYVNKKKWGFFTLIVLKAEKGNETSEKMVLTGENYNRMERPAIYLTNHNNFLYAIGNILIKGNSYVPGGVIKPGNISGRGFENNIRTKGGIFESNNALPKFDDSSFKYLLDLYEKELTSDSIIEIQDVELWDINNSFKNKTLIYSTRDKLLLENCKITGNVIIRSEKSIEIQSTSDLQGIIVIAPHVNIGKNFKWYLQIISSDSITVEEQCMLSYPSVLAVNGDSSVIRIKGNSIIQGGIIQTNMQKASNYSGVIVEKNVNTIGIIYSEGNIEYSGKLLGTLYADNVVFRYKSSKYNNVLSNVILNSIDTPEFYVSPVIFNKQSNLKIIEWLN